MVLFGTKQSSAIQAVKLSPAPGYGQALFQGPWSDVHVVSQLLGGPIICNHRRGCTWLSLIVACSAAVPSGLRSEVSEVSCAARCQLNAKRPAKGDKLRCGDTWRADSALLLMLTCVAVHAM